MSDQDRVEFSTKDLNQAAFIWCQSDAELLGLDQSGDSPTVHFRLSVPMCRDELSSLLFSYANGKTSVDPLAFAQNQSKLRDFLHLSKRRRST